MIRGAGCRSDPRVKNDTRVLTHRIGYPHPQIKLSSLGELDVLVDLNGGLEGIEMCSNVFGS
jgi:hypothetical protein